MRLKTKPFIPLQIAGIELLIACSLTLPFWPCPALAIPVTSVVITSEGKVEEAVPIECDEDSECESADCVELQSEDDEYCRQPDPCTVDNDCLPKSTVSGLCAKIENAKELSSQRICTYPPVDDQPAHDFCDSRADDALPLVAWDAITACFMAGGVKKTSYADGDCDADGIVNSEDCQPCDADSNDPRRRSLDQCPRISPSTSQPPTGASSDGIGGETSEPLASSLSSANRALSFEGGGGCSLAQSPTPSALFALGFVVSFIARRRRRKSNQR